MGNQISREFKNNVFCMLYAEKENLLSLYNAINGSSYSNADELEVVTLKDTMLLRMKNDTAFVIDHRLGLYEQQSTVNPNMVLRDLYYVAEEYQRLVPMAEVYGKKAVRIPAPHFIILYNGVDQQPAERIMKLSDLYAIPEKDPQLELIARQININKGYNDDILEKCDSLKGYMTFVDKVRGKRAEGISTGDAVLQAVDECILENVLTEFFREHRKEVIEMGRYEFDEDAYREAMMRDGRDEGKAEGKAMGLAEGIIRLIERMGILPETLRNMILNQKDISVLDRWFTLAMDATSVEGFVDAILSKD